MASRIAQLIGNLRAPVVRRRGPNAWIVKPPFAPWRYGPAERERQDLLGRMLTERAIGGFWIDVDHRDYLPDDIATVETPSGEPSPWLFVSGEDVGWAAGELHIGAWGLFLFDGVPDRPPPWPRHLDTDPEQATAMLEEIGGYALVFSWEDDIEWMIVESAAT